MDDYEPTQAGRAIEDFVMSILVTGMFGFAGAVSGKGV